MTHAAQCTKLPRSVPNPPEGANLPPEWRALLRELPRLLAEGQGGKWALIRGEEIVAVFDTWDDAHEEGHWRYGLRGFLTPCISAEQPIRQCQPWWLALSCPYILRLAAETARGGGPPLEAPLGVPSRECPRWLYLACPTLVIL